MTERFRGIPESLQQQGAEFAGFTPEQKQLVRQGVYDIGMPTDNIKKFRSKKPLTLLS